MNIEVEREEDSCTIKLEGRLDTGSAPELSATIDELMGDYRNLILDLEKTEYVTSAGLRVILKADMDLRNDGSFALINVSDEIAHLFSIAHFDTYISINGNTGEKDSEEKGEYYFEPGVLNRKQKEALPVIVRAILENPEIKVYELNNEEEETLSITVFLKNESKNCIDVLYMDIQGEDKESILKETISRVINLGKELEVSRISFLFDEKNELKEAMTGLCQNMDMESKGIEKIYLTYSMEQIKNSKLLQNIGQLRPKMSEIHNLSNIDSSTLLLLQISDTVDIDSLDPVFCRLCVRDNKVYGLLDAVQLDDENVVLKSINFADSIDDSNILILLFASFAEFLAEIMEDTAKLTVVIDKKSLLNVVAKILGKPEKTENYCRYVKEL